MRSHSPTSMLNFQRDLAVMKIVHPAPSWPSHRRKGRPLACCSTGGKSGADVSPSRRVVLIVARFGRVPLAVLELKNAAAENATIGDAFNQLQTYRQQIPNLFRTNAVLVTSDGIEARIGSLTADAERFMPWRTVTGEDFAHRGTPELETLLRGVFTREYFLALIRDFIVFGDKGDGPFKILGG